LTGKKTPNPRLEKDRKEQRIMNQPALGVKESCLEHVGGTKAIDEQKINYKPPTKELNSLAKDFPPSTCLLFTVQHDFFQVKQQGVTKDKNIKLGRKV
jgi:hypothetical protein